MPEHVPVYVREHIAIGDEKLVVCPGRVETATRPVWPEGGSGLEVNFNLNLAGPRYSCIIVCTSIQEVEAVFAAPLNDQIVKVGVRSTEEKSVTPVAIVINNVIFRLSTVLPVN